MATSGISFSGLASGLDTARIIDAMLRVDQSRIDGLVAQKTALSTQFSALGTLKSKLSSLQTTLSALRYESQVLARNATVSDTSILSATAGSGATLGTFNVWVDQLATATKRTGVAGVGREDFEPTASLAQSGLALTPTAGKFIVNGVQIDASTATTVQDFVDAINNQQAQVVAEAVDATGAPSANPVRIQLRNADGSNTAISLGSAADTSNFLAAAKLSTATQVGDRISSTDTLGRVLLGEPLNSARLSTALSAATGSFTINGVTFNWDAAVDSVSQLVADINGSTANVSASYDAVSNRVVLTSKGTGAQSISASDVSGNALAALGVTDAAGATETLGNNALYRIDSVAGGAQQSSTSNVISGVVPGVTLNLLQESTTAAKVTVGQDSENVVTAMKAFITAYNDVSDFIRANTRPDANDRPGTLQGNTAVRLLGDRLRNIATSAVAGLSGEYQSLAGIGVTTGAVGSMAGTTNSLVLDEEKFKSELESNPDAVFELLNSSVAGSEGVFSQMRTYITSATLTGGLISASTDSLTARQSSLDWRIRSSEERLEAKRERLEAQFARMEAALASLQTQGQRLQAQLSSLSSPSA